MITNSLNQIIDQNNYLFNPEDILKNITVIRSKRKTLIIEIKKTGEIFVRIPSRTSLELVKKILQNKKDWIIKKQKEILAKSAHYLPKKYLPGEEFYYLGEKRRLILVKNQPLDLHYDNYFFLNDQNQENAAGIFLKWYKKNAKKILLERVNYYAEIMNIKFQKITINQAKTRWGSCSKKGYINFSYRLLMAPLEIIDYVVVHELAHLNVMNHSSQFWDLVKTYYPDYQLARKILKKFTLEQI